MNLHFVGIGGIGMSGIAEVFLNQGFTVSGSDLTESELTRRLSALGAKISIGHQASNIDGAQLVVISSAVSETNPEVHEAKRRLIPVIPRAEMLAELMRKKIGIAVAGTHGKTTTTSMLATMLTHAGLDPTLIIGGRVDSLGGNAKLGKGKILVAEADESDGSFLRLPATYSVVTNIDNDHLDHYQTLNLIDDAFVQFVGQLPFYGLAAVCGEDPGIQRCLARFTKPLMTYGFSARFDFYATDLVSSGFTQSFSVYGRAGGGAPHSKLGVLTLHLPGRHNILNALGALIIGLQLDQPFDLLSKGLAEFRGVRRRFEVKWQNPRKQQVIIDDYAHHPTEIRATLAAARSYWPGRIVTVFQPHRYTRTLHCEPEFATAFKETDLLYLVDIYGAGEAPIQGVDSRRLTSRISQSGTQATYAGSLEDARNTVLTSLREGDLVLCLGAGSISKLSELLRVVLEERQ